MLTDSARSRRVYSLLLECFYSTHVCLYAGNLAPELKVVAPYLVPLEGESRNTRKFIDAAWGKSWSVFLKCDQGLDTLRRHLRGYLTVRDPQGERLLFRFYDPRVLKTYLPTCSSEELAAFFGPIECFWMESESAEAMLEFRLASGSLVQRTLSLAPGAVRTFHEPEALPGAPPAPINRATGELVKMRPAQMEAFSQAAVRKFERWMCIHLNRFFPEQAKALSYLQITELIGCGIERALEHGITTERDVCKFIDLMVIFGKDFDARLPWASQVLQSGKSPRMRMRILFEDAAAHLDRQ